MIVKTEAIVLRTLKYRDTSKIVILFTEDYGKLQCIAKGARSWKNKYGASLEPLAHTQVVFYKKEQRELHLISQATLLSSFKNIHTSLEHFIHAYGIIELLYRTTHSEEKNEILYKLLLNTLQMMDKVEDPKLLFSSFQLKYASLMGFTPSLTHCSKCGKAFETTHAVEWRIKEGIALCHKCSGNINGTLVHNISSTSQRVRLSGADVGLLQKLLSIDIQFISSLELNNIQRNLIESAVRSYIEYHMSDGKPLQSLALLESV